MKISSFWRKMAKILLFQFKYLIFFLLSLYQVQGIRRSVIFLKLAKNVNPLTRSLDSFCQCSLNRFIQHGRVWWISSHIIFYRSHMGLGRAGPLVNNAWFSVKSCHLCYRWQFYALFEFNIFQRICMLLAKVNFHRG